MATIVASLTLSLFAALSPSAAFAEPAPPAPSPPAEAAPVTLISPVDGQFIDSVPFTVTGTKAAGSSIQLHTGDSGNPVCIVRADDSTTFSCTVASIQQGPGVRLTAVQLLTGFEPLSASTPIRVLLPPTINSRSSELSSGLLQGSGYPGATVTIRTSDGRSWTAPVSSGGSWAYMLPDEIPSGVLRLSATQSAPFSGSVESAPSESLRVTLDRDAPPAPVITTPVAGATLPTGAAAYAGTGETGATVTVFAVTASGTDVVLCADVLVSAGQWSCTGVALPDGSATITAYQRDAASNTGAGSPPLTVSFGQAASTPSHSRPPATAPAESPTPAPVVPVPSAAPTESGAVPDRAPAPEGQWAEQTPFTTAVKGAIGPGTDLTWLRAVLLAILAIGLLLIPARMLATTLTKGRSRTHESTSARGPLTGRNRTPTHDDPDPLLRSPGARVRTIAALSVAGAIVLFARPVDGQPVYLRVFVASVLALIIVNAAATWVPVRFAAWRQLGSPSQRLSLLAFPVIAALALVSRVAELQPAFLFGLLFVVGLQNGSQRDRGQLGLARIGAVFATGLVAWLATTLIGTPVGFAGSFAAELVNIVAMTALGSAAIMMVPLGDLSGRAVLNWSRPAWFASALVVFTVLFAFLSPTLDAWQEQVAAIAVLVVLITFGAVGISLWLWRRVVTPNLSAG